MNNNSPENHIHKGRNEQFQNHAGDRTWKEYMVRVDMAKAALNNFMQQQDTPAGGTEEVINAILDEEDPDKARMISDAQLRFDDNEAQKFLRLAWEEIKREEEEKKNKK